MYPHCVTLDEIESLATEAYAALPEEVVTHLEREGWVVVIDEDREPDEVPHEPNKILGVCDHALKTIFLYGKSLMGYSWNKSAAVMQDTIAIVVRHEIAHALGMSHEEMEAKALKLWPKDVLV